MLLYTSPVTRSELMCNYVSILHRREMWRMQNQKSKLCLLLNLHIEVFSCSTSHSLWLLERFSSVDTNLYTGFLI